MKINKNFKLIGVETGKCKELNDLYKVNDWCFGLKFYKHNKTNELKVIIETLKDYLNGFFESFDDARKKANKGLTKKQIKDKQAKADAKFEADKDKPVDTSKWLRPDDESIRNELMTQLLLCELYKEDTTSHVMSVAKRDVLYSILHSNSPKNPQCLTEFAIIDDFDALLCEADNPLKNYTWNLVNKTYNGEIGMDKLRKERVNFRKKELAKMITVHKDTISKTK